MARAGVVARYEWRLFKHDRPGQRFTNHYLRTKQRASQAAIVGRAVIGAVLLLAGIAMLFAPGPGLIVSVFGLGLFASISQRLSSLLDRAEPPVRRGARRVLRLWQRLPVLGKIGGGLIAGAAVVVTGIATWRWFTI
jgi:hypothetical protein